MKKPLLLIATLLISLSGIAQTNYEPQLLILYPNNVSFDPSLKAEVDKKNDELKKLVETQLAALKPQNEADQPVNIKLMQTSTVAFLEHLDVFSQASFYSQQYLTYRFYEKFPNCLILLKGLKSKDNVEDLKHVADEQHTPYVLNFSDISIYKQSGETHCKLKIQLYEQASNSILINKEYNGDWNNHGFEFTCEQGSIGCTLNNSLSQALPEVIYQIASNSPILKQEKQIAEKRAAFITNHIYPQQFDESLIKQVISSSKPDIGLNDLYHGFYNEDKTKFVAFFIITIDKKDAKSLLKIKGDENVKVLTSKDIHDSGYLDQAPQTYAYIVRGVLYQGKWYVNKTEVTYFDAANITEGKISYLNNLQLWDYFAHDSTEPGLAFWEGKLFQKIEDKRKDPHWEKYKDMWASEERDHRDYVGMYEFMADELKKQREAADNAYRKQIINKALVPFYNEQVKRKSNHIIKADRPENFDLIYPKDKRAIINPIRITDENGITSIRYFVLIPKTNEVFEWTYVKPNILKNGEYADSPINKTIGAITPWNFSYKTLDDDAFWNEKVLLKDGDNYKFLRKL